VTVAMFVVALFLLGGLAVAAFFQDDEVAGGTLVLFGLPLAVMAVVDFGIWCFQ
jgi:hypothetical protein